MIWGMERPISSPSTAPTSEWARGRSAWVRWAEELRRNSSLLIGIIILAFFAIVSIAALVRWGTGVGDLSFNLALGNETPPPGPSLRHPFGVMSNWGVDIFSALVRATPIDFLLVVGPVAAASVSGAFLGAIGGYLKGGVDIVIASFADMFGSVPSFLLVWVLYVGIATWFRGAYGLLLFGILLAVVLCPNYVLLVRATAAEVSHEAYVESARASGSNPWRIVRKHVLPNSVSPVFSQIPFDVYSIFFILTLFPFISCYGVGGGGGVSLVNVVPSETFPEWGSYLANGICFGWSILPVLNYWWMYTFPLMAIVLFGLGVSLFCDGTVTFLTRS